jgi:hypothetical protein
MHRRKWRAILSNPANECAGRMRLSVPVAGLPNEKNESRDQGGHDQHPVLAFETQKGKMLDQKPHRSLPIFMQDRRFICAG